MASAEPPADEKPAPAAITADPGCQVAGPADPAAAPVRAGPGRLGGALRGLLRRPRLLLAVGISLGLLAAGLVRAAPQLVAWYHFRAARSELQRYHNPQAVRHLQACLHVWPDDSDALLLAARAARRARSYDEAERCLEKYRQARGPDDACAFEEVLLAFERTGDDRATEVCHRWVDQGHPDKPLVLEAVARGCLRQYRLPEARVALNRWLEIEPNNPQALCLEGQLHLDYERSRYAAVDSYRRAVELDPDHEEARQGLAVALLESKDYAGAAPHLEELQRRQPDNPHVRVGLAECRAANPDTRAEAVRLLDGVLAQRPRFAPALALRGRLALEDGQYEAAETWLRQASALDPRDTRIRNNLIVCLNRNGKRAEAEEHSRLLKDLEKAQKQFHDLSTREVGERPHDPALHCRLGELLLQAGYREEGLRWLHSALRLDPQYAPAREALARHARPKKPE